MQHFQIVFEQGRVTVIKYFRTVEGKETEHKKVAMIAEKKIKTNKSTTFILPQNINHNWF